MTVVDLNVIVRDVHQMLGLIGEHIAFEPQLAEDLDPVSAASLASRTPQSSTRGGVDSRSRRSAIREP